MELGKTHTHEYGLRRGERINVSQNKNHQKTLQKRWQDITQYMAGDAA